MPSRVANTPWAESRLERALECLRVRSGGLRKAAAVWGVSPRTSATRRSATTVQATGRSQAALICITISWGVGVMLLPRGLRVTSVHISNERSLTDQDLWGESSAPSGVANGSPLCRDSAVMVSQTGPHLS